MPSTIISKKDANRSKIQLQTFTFLQTINNNIKNYVLDREQVLTVDVPTSSKCEEVECASDAHPCVGTINKHASSFVEEVKITVPIYSAVQNDVITETSLPLSRK